MITDKRLQYIKSTGDVDFYKFRPTLFRYFYKPMAYYERLFSRTVRETLDFLRGGYYLVYLAIDDHLVGYGTVVRGGGRYRFCTSKQRILCNIFIKEEERGKGYSNILVEYTSVPLKFWDG